jgi:hypothetical protein
MNSVRDSGAAADPVNLLYRFVSSPCRHSFHPPGPHMPAGAARLAAALASRSSFPPAHPPSRPPPRTRRSRPCSGPAPRIAPRSFEFRIAAAGAPGWRAPPGGGPREGREWEGSTTSAEGAQGAPAVLPPVSQFAAVHARHHARLRQLRQGRVSIRLAPDARHRLRGHHAAGFIPREPRWRPAAQHLLAPATSV